MVLAGARGAPARTADRTSIRACSRQVSQVVMVRDVVREGDGGRKGAACVSGWFGVPRRAGDFFSRASRLQLPLSAHDTSTCSWQRRVGALLDWKGPVSPAGSTGGRQNVGWRALYRAVSVGTSFWRPPIGRGVTSDFIMDIQCSNLGSQPIQASCQICDSSFISQMLPSRPGNQHSIAYKVHVAVHGGTVSRTIRTVKSRGCYSCLQNQSCW